MDRMDLAFFRGKRVLITGHTGFKGSWLCQILLQAGSEITGYALPAPTHPNLFAIAGLEKRINSVSGDIRDLQKLKTVFDAARPEIVFHLAAQPLVRDSYKDPVYTYETNVMGTVNLLECVRSAQSPVYSVVNVTTDKVYLDHEGAWSCREDDPLDGFDPYSNSKSCSELVTHSYKNSFFTSGIPAVSTARAGNVIGGGDFAVDRIIPDCVRAVEAGRPVVVRNPHSVRPYQHILEPLFVYLMIARRQYEKPSLAGWYNVGPDEQDCVTTGELVGLFCEKWGSAMSWVDGAEIGAPHETDCLRLDCSKLKSTFGWRPRWHLGEAVEKTVEWTKVWHSGGDISAVMDQQITEYLGV